MPLPMTFFQCTLDGRAALLSIALMALSCGAEPVAPSAPESSGTEGSGQDVRMLSKGSGLAARPMPVPAASNGLWPAWAAGAEPSLIWTEAPEDGSQRLVSSRLVANEWSAPSTIAEGGDWFINWADFPQICEASPSTLLAAWLAKTGSKTFDYEIQLALSSDGGFSWRECGVLHNDGVQAEHGFVTLTALPENFFSAVWLDGRNTVSGEGEERGAMALYTAEIDERGRVQAEHALDLRVCDCCGTAATGLEDGTLLVVYRDRAADEVRDISIVRGIPGQPESWSDPQSVCRDAWLIAGCPVNGPRIVSRGKQVWVLWFTMEDSLNPRVKLARSHDGGLTFDAPIRVDEGSAWGRVDLAFLPDGQLVVSWLAGDELETNWCARIVNEQGRLDEVLQLVQVSGKRDDGFLRLVSHADGVLAAFRYGEDRGLALLRLTLAGR